MLKKSLSNGFRVLRDNKIPIFFGLCILGIICSAHSVVSNNITINPSNSTIQEAINNASDNDTIILGPGIYNESNVQVNKTGLTITAAIPGTVTVNAGGTDRVFNVVRSNVILSGLTITGGNTTIGNSGGGVYLNSGDSVVNCSIINNTAGSDSGGVHASGSGDSVVNCSIINNTAGDDGGGLTCFYGSVVNCSIVGNNASDDGGGVYLGAGSGGVANVINCSIVGNNASDGGGAFIGGNNYKVVSCSIMDNTAISSGGGVYVESGNLNYCRVLNNTASNGKEAYRGGGGVDFNWWGKNNITQLIDGMQPNSYYIARLGVGDFYTSINGSIISPVPLSYDLVLNNTNTSTNVSMLPDFNATIKLNNDSNVISAKGSWSTVWNDSGDYRVLVDNLDLHVMVVLQVPPELQNLQGEEGVDKVANYLSNHFDSGSSLFLANFAYNILDNNGYKVAMMESEIPGDKNHYWLKIVSWETGGSWNFEPFRCVKTDFLYKAEPQNWSKLLDFEYADTRCVKCNYGDNEGWAKTRLVNNHHFSFYG